MLIAFLIRDEEDWKVWRKGLTEVKGKPIVHVNDKKPGYAVGDGSGGGGGGGERASALDEVETFDDDEDTLTERE